MGNVENLTNRSAVKKLKELVKEAHVCHFVTALTHLPLSSRPMAVLDVDDEGTLWFFSKDSSEKIAEIAADAHVQLFFAHNSGSEYLSVYGDAETLKDVQRAKELWTPIAKSWFPDGVDDSSLMIVKVKPVDAYYWDTKHNKLVTLVKMLAGAMTGKELDDGVEGTIKVGLQHHQG